MGSKWYNAKNFQKRMEEDGGLFATEFIKHKVFNDLAAPYIIEGEMGIGKTSYSTKAVAQYFYDKGVEDPYEEVKKHMVFRPSEFLEYIIKLQGPENRVDVLIWDDAGLWLYALDWHEPIIKRISKYLTAMRSDMHVIILTTPDSEWIVKKIRTLPGALQAKVTMGQGTKKANGKKYPSTQRIGRIYNPWKTQDKSKSGTKAIYEDEFSKMMPNEFFEWYKPHRDKFVSFAKKLMLMDATSADEFADMPEIQAELRKVEDKLKSSELLQRMSD